MRFLLRTYTLGFLLVLCTTGLAAAQTLRGQVLDAETGEPLPGANVLVARSTRGGATSPQGNFAIEGFSTGQYELVVRYIGYTTQIVPLRWPHPEPLVIKLQPNVSELAEVTVSGKRDWGWRSRFQSFKEILLGPTSYARYVDIENPEVVTVTEDANGLVATATDPILLTNNALGYRISLELKLFNKQGQTLSYSGLPIFEPMETTNSAIQKRWEQSREEAYRGSKQHFFDALAANQLEAEGFEVTAVRYMQSREAYTPIARLSYEEMCTPTDNGLLELNTREIWRVQYLEEATDPLSWGGLEYPGAINQTSLLYFSKPTLLLTPDGRLLSPQAVKESGYWFRERLAVLLPEEYSLVEPLSPSLPESHPQKNGFALSQLLVPAEDLVSGGVGRDQIPALNSPDMVAPTAAEATYLHDDDPVLALNRNGVAKAYPLRILEYHEVVNDRFGDEPLVITYCPLCGSGIAFQRQVGDRTLSFGVSGLLYQSDVLLYDRQTESLWSQLEMKAIAGPQSGSTLQPIGLELTTWGKWKMRFPNTTVLSDRTGHPRDYTQSAYADYRSSDRLSFPVAHTSEALPPKARVVGVQVGDEFLAYPYAALAKHPGPLEQEINGEKFVLYYQQETETVRVLANEQVTHLSIYWFAWYTFHPDTRIWQPEP